MQYQGRESGEANSRGLTKTKSKGAESPTLKWGSPQAAPEDSLRVCLIDAKGKYCFGGYYVRKGGGERKGGEGGSEGRPRRLHTGRHVTFKKDRKIVCSKAQRRREQVRGGTEMLKRT